MQKISAEKKQAIREAYAGNGWTYQQIVQVFQIARSTVSDICCDLSMERKQKKPKYTLEQKRELKRKRAAQIRADPSLIRHKNCILTVDDVVAIRRAIRTDGYMRLKKYAEHYGTSESVISVAARGGTFTAANSIEPPITEKLPPVPKPKKKFLLKPELANKVIELRQEDPIKWTYTTLSHWLREKTGRLYKAVHVKRLILTKHPELEALEKQEPPKYVPVPRRKQVQGRKPLTVQQREQKTLLAKKRRDDLRAMEEQERQYTREVKAGLHGAQLQQQFLEFERRKKAA